MHGLTIERDHDAHVNKEKEGFDHCHQVVVHCETREEAEELFDKLGEEYDFE